MKLCKWEDLPDSMQTDAVLPYYEVLSKKNTSLFIKRAFDIFAGSVLLILFSPLFLIVSVMIALDSKGGVFYKQERITQYAKPFQMYKFRTMVANADKKGLLTTNNDPRITKVGRFIRRVRIDEIPQLLNIIKGEMTFVATRPEVKKYVLRYTPEMMATLLIPAGVTSEASVMYKDEHELLKDYENADDIYISRVLPEKMSYNLKSLISFSLLGEIKTIVKTIGIMFGAK